MHTELDVPPSARDVLIKYNWIPETLHTRRNQEFIFERFVASIANFWGSRAFRTYTETWKQSYHWRRYFGINLKVFLNNGIQIFQSKALHSVL